MPTVQIQYLCTYSGRQLLRPWLGKRARALLRRYLTTCYASLMKLSTSSPRFLTPLTHDASLYGRPVVVASRPFRLLYVSAYSLSRGHHSRRTGRISLLEIVGYCRRSHLHHAASPSLPCRYRDSVLRRSIAEDPARRRLTFYATRRLGLEKSST